MVQTWRKRGMWGPSPEDSQHEHLCLTVHLSLLCGWPHSDQLSLGDRGHGGMVNMRLVALSLHSEAQMCPASGSQPSSGVPSTVPCM